MEKERRMSMELISTIFSLQDMPILKQVDSFLLGHCFYATYLTASFSKNQLKQAKSFCKKKSKKIIRSCQ